MAGSADVEVEVVDVPERLLAVVAKAITWSEFPSAWRPMLDEVWAFLGDNPGLRTTGHNVMRYNDGPPEVHVEIGVEVTRTFEPAGNVQPSVLPAGRAARAVFHGDPTLLAATHEAVYAWCKDHGLDTPGDRWEIYGDPGPDGMDVEVYRRIAD